MRKPTRAAPGDWPGQLRRDLQFAEGLLTSRGELAPMAIIFAADAVRLVPFTEELAPDRAEFLRFVRVLATAHNADAVTMMSEAWVARVKQLPSEGAAAFHTRASGIRPSKTESRIEAVVVSLAYRDPATGERAVIGAMREIERRASGKIAGLRAVPGFSDGEGPQGDFGELLPEEAPDARTQALARATLEALGITSEPAGRRPFDA